MKPLLPERMERVLIRGTNWVGDAVMSVPALKEIRHRFSKAHITLLVKPWVRDVYGEVDFIDEVLVYDKDGSHKGRAGMRVLLEELRIRRFDMAILLPNSFEAAYIAFRARIPTRLGYARDGRGLLLTHAVRMDPDVRKVHQLYYYLGILSGAGLMDARLWERTNFRPHSITVGLREADRIAARRMLQDYGISQNTLVVGIHPGASYGGAKRWPSDRYALLADAIAEDFPARIVIFGAPGERHICEEVAAQTKCDPVLLAGRTSLGQLMGLIRECRLFISNDSGPMHLAAALRVPQLAIFGSTSEIATGPLSDHARVLKHPVACNPCFLRECPTDFRCMLELTVAEVLAAAQEKLQKETGSWRRVE